MDSPQLHIFRHHNKVVVDQFMEHFRSDLDPRKNLTQQTAINPAYLKIMKALASMREAADRSNMGFFGAFITPEGLHYSISNIESTIENNSQQPQDYIQINEGTTIDDLYKLIKITETPEGIQLRLTDETC